uniref:Uncharacterized protein n=1 Tax=Plectus sambesii TaxID=2011161 RepID=A0A914VX17_9BILA
MALSPCRRLTDATGGPIVDGCSGQEVDFPDLTGAQVSVVDVGRTARRRDRRRAIQDKVPERGVAQVEFVRARSRLDFPS